MGRWREFGDLGLILAFFVVCAFALHLGSAALGYSFYRDIHLGTALTYARGTIDLARPIIVGFNANGAATPQELPLWQAAAAMVMKVRGEWFGWANLVSLCIYLTALWPFSRIAATVLGEGRAVGWALVLFASQPLVVVFSGYAGTDILCLALITWFTFFGLRALKKGGGGWWTAAALSGAVCAISKAPFFMVAGLTMFFLLVLEHRAKGDLRKWVAMAGVGAFALIVFMMWTWHTDMRIAEAEFAYIDLRVKGNPAMQEWYFGTMEERTDPMVYAKGGWRFMTTMMGSFALLVLPLVGFFSERSRFARMWILSALVTTAVFFNLVLVHRHYYLMFSPGVALAAGQGAFLIEGMWRKWAEMMGGGTKPRRWFPVLASMVIALGLAQGLVGMEVVRHYDPYERKITELIETYTEMDDRLLVYGGGWGGRELFLSGRQGLSLRNLEVVKDEKAISELRKRGFTKLVMISESPLLHALQVTNPGGQERVRDTYHRALVAEVEDWTEVYASEDILVKEVR